MNNDDDEYASDFKPSWRFVPGYFGCIKVAKANTGVESKSFGCFSHRTTIQPAPKDTK